MDDDEETFLHGGECVDELSFINHGESEGNYKVISEKLVYLIIYRNAFEKIIG